MSYLRCSNCGYKQNLNANKYRLLGLGVATFGVIGWFGFLFAGSGHAFLISCGIVAVGIFLFVSAKKMAKNSTIEQRCPKCSKCEWEDGFDLFNN